MDASTHLEFYGALYMQIGVNKTYITILWNKNMKT